MVEHSTMEEEVDLYEDIFLPINLKEHQDSNDEENNQSADLISAEVLELKQMSTQLSAQNTALKKNISCLYKTAQLELERKESVIEKLTKQIKWLEKKLTFHELSGPRNRPTQTEVTTGSEASLKSSGHYREGRNGHLTRGKSSIRIEAEKRDREKRSPHTKSRAHDTKHHSSNSLPRTAKADIQSRTKSLIQRDQDSKHSLSRGEDRLRHRGSRSTSPLSKKSIKERTRDHESKEARKHERRHHHSPDKENREYRRRSERKRKCTQSPPHTCSPDLREVLTQKAKRSRGQASQKADTHSTHLIRSHTSDEEQSTCSITPSLEELVEVNLLELEFDEDPSNVDLSCPNTPTQWVEGGVANGGIESVSSSCGESGELKREDDDHSLCSDSDSGQLNHEFDMDRFVSIENVKQSILVEEYSNSEVAFEEAIETLSETETNDALVGKVVQEPIAQSECDLDLGIEMASKNTPNDIEHIIPMEDEFDNNNIANNLKPVDITTTTCLKGREYSALDDNETIPCEVDQENGEIEGDQIDIDDAITAQNNFNLNSMVTLSIDIAAVSNNSTMPDNGNTDLNNSKTKSDHSKTEVTSSISELEDGEIEDSASELETEHTPEHSTQAAAKQSRKHSFVKQLRGSSHNHLRDQRTRHHRPLEVSHRHNRHSLPGRRDQEGKPCFRERGMERMLKRVVGERVPHRRTRDEYSRMKNGRNIDTTMCAYSSS